MSNSFNVGRLEAEVNQAALDLQRADDHGYLENSQNQAFHTARALHLIARGLILLVDKIEQVEADGFIRVDTGGG